MILAKTKNKVFFIVLYSLLLLAVIAFPFLIGGKMFIFMKIIYYPTYIILVIVDLMFIIIPNKRVILKDKELVIKYSFVDRKWKYTRIINVNDLMNVFYDHDILYLTTISSGIIRMPLIKDIQEVVKVMEKIMPEHSHIMDYAMSGDLSKIDQFEGNFYCHYLFLYLNVKAKTTNLSDEILDVFLYLDFYNEFLKGNIEMFFISHNHYIERLRNFISKLDLNWIPTYLDNIIKMHPAFDEHFIDNIIQVFKDKESNLEFQQNIIENASTILKINQENDFLMVNSFIKYVKENNIIDLIKEEFKEGEEE